MTSRGPGQGCTRDYPDCVVHLSNHASVVFLAHILSKARIVLLPPCRMLARLAGLVMEGCRMQVTALRTEVLELRKNSTTEEDAKRSVPTRNPAP